MRNMTAPEAVAYARSRYKYYRRQESNADLSLVWRVFLAALVFLLAL